MKEYMAKELLTLDAAVNTIAMLKEEIKRPEKDTGEDKTGRRGPLAR